MLNQKEILSTIEMIDQQHLDIRTITMGISLLDCADPDPKAACRKSMTRSAGRAQTWCHRPDHLKRSLASPLSTSGCR